MQNDSKTENFEYIIGNICVNYERRWKRIFLSHAKWAYAIRPASTSVGKDFGAGAESKLSLSLSLSLSYLHKTYISDITGSIYELERLLNPGDEFQMLEEVMVLRVS